MPVLQLCSNVSATIRLNRTQLYATPHNTTTKPMKKQANIHIHPQFGGGFAAFLVESAEQFSVGFFGSTRERAEAHARGCGEQAGYDLGATVQSEVVKGIGVRHE
jgi:hypothetical protein